METSRQKLRIGFVAFLLLLSFLLALIGLFGGARSGPVQRVTSWFAPPEDGSWAAISLDGRPVSWREYRVAVRDRRVVGGRDGCNDWAYQDERPDARGERSIISTLQACPEEPNGQAIRALAFSGTPVLRPDGTLLIRANGHLGIFRRCEWTTERTATSAIDTCVPA